MNLSIPDKILRYEQFLNDHLKEDLRKVYLKHDVLNTEISEYIQLKNSLQAIADIGSLEDGFKTKMDIGCSFYAQANVPDISHVFVDVGLGCFVEFTHDEALQFIEKRIALLTTNTKKLKKDSAQIKGRIKFVLGALGELQKGL